MSESLPVVDCSGCGACCTHMGHPHFFWRPDAAGGVDPHWEGVPAHLKEELQQYIEGLEDIDLGQPCIWYDRDKRRCRHYEHRPQMCRDFETGNPHCLRMRFEQGIDSVRR